MFSVACRNGCKYSFRPWPLRDTLRVSRVPLTTHRHGAAGAGRFYWPARRKRRHGVEPFLPPVLLPLHATGHQHPPGTGEPRAPPSTPLRHRSSPATSTLADRTRAANHGGVGDRYDPASTSQSPIHTAWRRCRDERRRRNGGRCRNSSSSSSLGAGGRSTRPTNAAARARPAHAQNGGRQPAGASLCPSSWPRDPTPSHEHLTHPFPGRTKWPCWPPPLACFAPSAPLAADPPARWRRTKAATDRTNARSSASPVSVKASTLNANLQQPRLRGAERPGRAARRARAQRNRSRRRRSACCCNISTTINTCRLRCARHTPCAAVLCPVLRHTVSTHAFHLSAVRAAADVAVDAARARPEEGPPYPFFANPSPNCLSLFAHTSTVLALRGPVAATSLLLTA